MLVVFQEAFRAREAELMAKSETAWKQYQEQRGEWCRSGKAKHSAMPLSKNTAPITAHKHA